LYEHGLGLCLIKALHDDISFLKKSGDIFPLQYHLIGYDPNGRIDNGKDLGHDIGLCHTYMLNGVLLAISLLVSTRSKSTRINWWKNMQNIILIQNPLPINITAINQKDFGLLFRDI